MEYKDAKAQVDLIFNDVFGKTLDLDEQTLVKRFCKDIQLPVPKKCELSGVETWIYPDEGKKFVSKEASVKKTKEDDWMRPKKPISSMKDLLSLYEEIDFNTGGKGNDSVNVFKSDEIMNSSEVYYSALIGNSKNVYYSYNNFNCNYIFATRGSNSCTFGIRFKENGFCSSGFEVDYSGKVSKSMFIKNSFDLFECLFCTNLGSKKYCIANMQFEKDEYFKIKEMVVNWVLNEYEIQ